MKLNHIDVQTTDVRATAQFFERHCGFSIRSNAHSDALVFLTDDDGLVLVLQRMKPGERHPEGFHVGFHVNDDQTVLDFHERARADGLEVSDVQRNGRGTQIYCHAPGGVLVEVSHPRRSW
jgi:catechol 2,3-dioxygenase-like lactoylglutathione lyase family enzyme